MQLTRKKQLLLISAALLLLLNSVAAVSYYYWRLKVPSEKVISYNAQVFIDGVEWSNGTKLVWDGNDTKQLDVLNLGTVPAYVYVTAEGLPTGWNLTWTKNGMQFYPGTWLNGTLTLQHTNEPGNYTWNMYVKLSGGGVTL